MLLKLFPRTLLFLIFTCICNNAYAGAWVEEPGSINIINSLYLSVFSEYYDKEGKTKPVSEFYKAEFKPFLEYGITHGYSVGFSPSFQSVASVSNGQTDRNEAFAFAELFAKAEIFKDDQKGRVFSIMPLLEIPGVYNEKTTPFFGKKELYWGIYGLYGQNIYHYQERYSYLNLETGIKSRISDSFTGEAGTSLKANLLTSFPFKKTVDLNLEMDFTKSLTSVSNAGNVLERAEYDLLKFQISGIKHFDDYSAELGYYQNLYGRNTGSGGGVMLSLRVKR